MRLYRYHSFSSLSRVDKYMLTDPRSATDKDIICKGTSQAFSRTSAVKARLDVLPTFQGSLIHSVTGHPFPPSSVGYGIVAASKRIHAGVTNSQGLNCCVKHTGPHETQYLGKCSVASWIKVLCNLCAAPTWHVRGMTALFCFLAGHWYCEIIHRPELDLCASMSLKSGASLGDYRRQHYWSAFLEQILYQSRPAVSPHTTALNRPVSQPAVMKAIVWSVRIHLESHEVTMCTILTQKRSGLRAGC